MPALFRNASWSGAAAAFRAVSGLINALLAIRLLGVVDYGHVATILALFVLYLSLNSSIFTALVVKLMAPDAVGEKQAILLTSSSIFSVLSIVVLVFVTLLLRELVPRLMSIEPGNFLNVEIRQVVLLMGLLTAIQILAALHSALIESCGRLDLAMKRQLIGPMVVLILLAVFFFTGVKVTTSGYVISLCAGALTDLCLLWFAKHKLMKVPLPYWPKRKHLEGLVHLLKSGGVLQAASLLGMFLEPLNKLLLNHFVGPAAVTLYDLAMKVIWGIQYLFAAAMRVFLHIGSKNVEDVGRSFTKVIALAGVPVLIFHAVGVLFLSWTAHHWVAIDATQLMLFFSIATVSNLGMIYITPLYLSLIGRGDLGFIFQSHLIVAVTNLIASLILIPAIGVIGAAFGLLAATLFNVKLIYARCKDSSGMLHRNMSALKERRMAYALVVLLFVAAIILSITGKDNNIGVLGVLLGLVVMMAREPMAAMIIERLRSVK